MAESVKQYKSELTAGRWAKALIELTLEDAGLTPEKVLEDLKSIVETIQSSEELSETIKNPAISTAEKQIIICKLFQDKVIPIVYNFIFALNLKKRLNIIDAICDAYEKEVEKLKNILRVTVTSAIDLNDEKKNDIREKLSKKLSKDVLMNWNVNSEIIAGLVFNINETVVDNSVKHKLDSIGKSIIKS